MTISNDTRIVVYTGNGLTTVFPYSFLIPDNEDAVVSTYEIATGLTTPLDPSAYEITGLGNPEGGQVTYDPDGTPMSSAFRLIIERRVDFVQETTITNQGGFLPEVVESALDRVVMMSQQLKEEVGRSIKVPAADTGTDLETLVASVVALSADLDSLLEVQSNLNAINTLVPEIADINTAAASILNINAVAAVDTEVATMAGLTTQLTGVYNIRNSVTAVDAIDSAVVIVASMSLAVQNVSAIDDSVPVVAGIATEVEGVAALDSNIQALHAIRFDITDVADIRANVTTVANNNTAVSNVAANITPLQNVNGALTAVNTVSTNIANVNALGPRASDLQALGPLATPIQNLGAITTAITNVNNIRTAVTNVSSISSAVSTVSTNSPAVSNVSSNIIAIDNVYDNMSSILAVEAELPVIGSKLNRAGDQLTGRLAFTVPTVVGNAQVNGGVMTIPAGANFAFAGFTEDVYDFSPNPGTVPNGTFLILHCTGSGFNLYQGSTLVTYAPGAIAIGNGDTLWFISTPDHWRLLGVTDYST